MLLQSVVLKREVVIALRIQNGSDGTIFELPSEQAVAQFLSDFRTWCLTDEAAKLTRQLPAVGLSA